MNIVRIVSRKRRCKLCWNRSLFRQWRGKDLISWEGRTEQKLLCWGKKMGKPLFRRKSISWSWTSGKIIVGAKASFWRKRKTSSNKFCVVPKGIHQNFHSKCWEVLNMLICMFLWKFILACMSMCGWDRRLCVDGIDKSSVHALCASIPKNESFQTNNPSK